MPFVVCSSRFHFLQIGRDTASFVDHSKLFRMTTTTTSTTTTIMTTATPLVGQVGGFNTAKTKRPMLQWNDASSSSGRVLKPVRSDVRGIREVTFYDALQVASAEAPHGSSPSEQSPAFTRICHQYANFLMGAGGGKNHGATSQAPTSRTSRTTATKDDVAPEHRPLLWGSMVLRWPRSTHSHSSDKHTLEEQKRVLLMAVKEEVIALRRLKRFTPLYHGVVQVNCHSYLCLEDLTQGFAKSNVMDVKLGTQTFEPDAPHDKRLRELQKYPQQSEFGMRIVGMRVYNNQLYYHRPAAVPTIVPHFCLEGNGFQSFDKHFGRSLSTRDLLLSAFRIFFNGTIYKGPNGGTTSEMSSSSLEDEDENSSPENITTTSDEHASGSLVSSLRTQQRATVSSVLGELKAIRNWFEVNRSFCFCASSLLIVFEGDTIRDSSNSHNNSSSSCILQTEKVQVKMIDFARVRRSDVGDPGYMVGLTTLINIMADLLQETTPNQYCSL
jgi:Inositol polyphosphate kinase